MSSDYYNRITRDEMFMDIARIVAKRGTCRRLQVGCIIIDENNRVISIGYVGSPPGKPHCLDEGCIFDENEPGCQRTIHAEVNAIGYAARVGTPIVNGSLYTTVSPCYKCAQLVVSAGITEVVYGEFYRDQSGIQYLEKLGVFCRFLE